MTPTINNFYNADAAKDIIKIEEEIQDESENPEADKQKIAELRVRQFHKGLEMNIGIMRPNTGRPY